MAQITYADKVTMNENASIDAINKVRAADMNEIKEVVNDNATGLGDYSSLTTPDTTDVVSGINSLVGEVLYDNTSGTNGTVNLSSSAANYSYMEIYFRPNDSQVYQSSVKICSPNGKYAFLMYNVISSAGTTVYSKMKNVYIDGTTITNYGNRYSEMGLSSTVSTQQSNSIYIVRVVGYK